MTTSTSMESPGAGQPIEGELQIQAQRTRCCSKVTIVALTVLAAAVIAGATTCALHYSPEIYGSLFGVAGVSLITVVLASCRGVEHVAQIEVAGDQQEVAGDQQEVARHQPPAAVDAEPPAAAGHQPPAAAGHQPPPAAGHQPPAAGHQPPAAGHQPPAAGHQPPAAGDQPPADPGKGMQGVDGKFYTLEEIEKMTEGEFKMKIQGIRPDYPSNMTAYTVYAHEAKRAEQAALLKEEEVLRDLQQKQLPMPTTFKISDYNYYPAISIFVRKEGGDPIVMIYDGNAWVKDSPVIPQIG